MLDYKLVEAMAMVVREGGFERAGNRLAITQSAVSQRVKLLEEQVGQVLMVRSSPPRPTRAGKQILKHYQQVASLEKGVWESLSLEKDGEFTSLSIGINEDSLATWFPVAVQSFVTAEKVTLDLKVDDQEQTLTHLKAGEVMGCISSHDQPVQGCTMHRLGTMRYRLTANPRFVAHWFPHGVTGEAVRRAPAVIFNRRDTLHEQVLSRCLDSVPDHFPIHYIPSSEQFVAFVEAGIGYGAVPDLQGSRLIDKGSLVDLAPEQALDISLYWHVWSHRSRLLQKLTEVLGERASEEIV